MRWRWPYFSADPRENNGWHWLRECRSKVVDGSGLHWLRQCWHKPPNQRPDRPQIAKNEPVQRRFARLAWLGAGIGAVVLLFPAYFDTRFALPVWPVVAVAMGSSFGRPFFRLPALPKALLGLGFAGSLLWASTVAVAREPLFPTYWKTTALIDELVDRFGVSNLVNVGNCAAWNVCKTGLMNELRHDPNSCFVLHDATRLPRARWQRLFETADAVVVLGRSDLSEAVMQVAPGLNRGYGEVVDTLEKDPNFERVAWPATADLPELLVFVRQARPGARGRKVKVRDSEEPITIGTVRTQAGTTRNPAHRQAQVTSW